MMTIANATSTPSEAAVSRVDARLPFVSVAMLTQRHAAPTDGVCGGVHFMGRVASRHCMGWRMRGINWPAVPQDLRAGLARQRQARTPGGNEFAQRLKPGRHFLE